MEILTIYDGWMEIWTIWDGLIDGNFGQFRMDRVTLYGWMEILDNL